MTYKALFVDLEEDIYDRHGIFALAGTLKREGIEVGYLSGSSDEKRIQAIREMKPDVILYSTYSSYFRKYAAFDEKLKEAIDVYSLIGGPCITFNPGILNTSTINAACMGEGDIALPQFFRDGLKPSMNIFENGSAPSSQFHPFADLDSLPLPDRSIIYADDYVRRDNPTKTFISGRGCPFKCTYCFNHRYNKVFRDCGKIVRKKSVDYIFEEVAGVRKAYPLKMALFNDDTFIIDKKWFFEFAERFPREVGIPYACNIRANLIDEDIVRALAESGCQAVNWSIESGNDFLRNEVLKRNMSREQILNTAELMNKYNIRHRIGNVIGLPGETMEQAYETLELNIQARPFMGLANVFVPFPGLDLTNYAIDNGYYSEIPEDHLPLNYFSHSVMDIPPDANETIQRLMCLFPIFVRWPELYRDRKRRERLQRLPKFVLRIMYEAFYAINFKELYKIKGDMLYTAVTGLRYMRNLVGSLLSKK